MSIEQVVQSKYGAVATSGRSSNQDGVRAVAEAFGMPQVDVESVL